MGAKVRQKFTEPVAKTSARRPQWGERDKLGQSEEKLRGEEVISLILPTASLNLIRPGSLRRSLPPSRFSPITQTKQKQSAAASLGCTSSVDKQPFNDFNPQRNYRWTGARFHHRRAAL